MNKIPISKKKSNNRAAVSKSPRRKPSRVKKTVHENNDWPINWKEKYLFWNQRKIPLAAIEDLAEHMIEVVLSDRSIITLSELCLRHYITPEDAENYCEKSSKFRRAYMFVKRYIGNNRELGALRKQLESSMVKFMQGVYDPSWKAQEIYFNELKIKANSALATPDEYAEISRKIFGEIPKKDESEGG